MCYHKIHIVSPGIQIVNCSSYELQKIPFSLKSLFLCNDNSLPIDYSSRYESVITFFYSSVTTIVFWNMDLNKRKKLRESTRKFPYRSLSSSENFGHFHGEWVCTKSQSDQRPRRAFKKMNFTFHISVQSIEITVLVFVYVSLWKY